MTAGTPGVDRTFATEHLTGVGDARDLPLADDSVDLVVTSPPYPMVEQWDGLFAELNPAAGEALAAAEGGAAWDEIARVLAPGGVACVDVGDATRSAGDRFRLWDNTARVADALADRGLDRLPGVLWHKPTNSPTKFMGSGTLPPSAYVTLEHETVLVFRNGERRSFAPGDPARYASAFFWEERNRWFSESWEGLRGAGQALDPAAPRERSAAFPFELPYRLICMYSTYGDRVLDPFWGTGTTTLAAMAAGRDSVGVERDPGFLDGFRERADGLPALSRERARRRLRDHRAFLADREETPAYEATHHDFRVVTRRERDVRVYAATDVAAAPTGYRVRHEAIGESDG